MKNMSFNLKKIIGIAFLSIIVALCMVFCVQSLNAYAEGIVTSGDGINFYSKGASIKQKTSAEDTKNGIRFDVRVEKDVYDALDDAKFTVHMTFDGQTKDYDVDFEDALNKGAIKVEDGFYSFYTYIYNIPAEKFDKAFTFSATISDSENEYTCASVSKSVSEVAFLASLTGITTEYEENGWADYISSSYLIDKTLESDYETVAYTAYNDGTKNDSALTYSLFDSDSETVHKVLLGTESVEFTAETTGFSLDAADIAAYGSETTSDVYAFTENHVYKVDLDLTTATISTEEGFVAMLSAAKAAASQNGGFTGYYRLTKSLDFTGYDVLSSMMQTNNQATDKNWQATFDGQGYALKNINYSWVGGPSGLFGEIGAKGVIKNVVIDNPKQAETDGFYGYGGIVASNVAGLIENVYVKVATIYDSEKNGGLIRYAMASAVIKNCVIEYNGATLSKAYLYTTSNAGATISNCYAITSATARDIAVGSKVASVAELYDTLDNGLTMLTKTGTTLYWGNTAIGEYDIVWTDISTEEEFIAMLSAAKSAASQAGGFTGYYRLTKSLDFTGYDVLSSMMQTNNQATDKNWQATFDGQGYALENINYSWVNSTGLFGEIGVKGVIKNLAIINPMGNETTNIFYGYGGIIAMNCAGLIENVYVKVANIYNHASNTGGLVKYAMSGSVIRNCVIEYNGGNLTGSALYFKSNGGVSISNCYAITTATFPDAASGTTVASVAELYGTANNGLKMLTKTGETYYWGKVIL